MSRLLRALLLGLALLGPVSSFAADAPAILLAGVYRNKVDVTQYLVSEKLDGVRAIWDGEQLRFRSGKEIKAPGWFLNALPKQALDGELYLGRGQFERLSGIVRREVPDDAEWRQVTFMIFEMPGASGYFRERAEAMRQLAMDSKVPWLREIEQFSVVDRKSLQSHLDAVLADGGGQLLQLGPLALLVREREARLDHLRHLAGRCRVRQCVDGEETIGLCEGRDRA